MLVLVQSPELWFVLLHLAQIVPLLVHRFCV
jgi:hypothetical protein